jgi:hypothetical protein
LFHAQQIARINDQEVILHDLGGKIQERTAHLRSMYAERARRMSTN